jgi:hypothetical protein
LHYKITFTFSFPSLEEAIDPNGYGSKKDGEFSFRLFAEHLGYSRKFDEAHLKIVNDFYEKLIWSEYNIDPEMDCLKGPTRDPAELEVWRKAFL